jgi:hypothetical protein
VLAETLSGGPTSADRTAGIFNSTSGMVFDYALEETNPAIRLYCPDKSQNFSHGAFIGAWAAGSGQPDPWMGMTMTHTAFSGRWGMIPVTARLGKTEWKTSLFPKEGRYIVPLKDSVRKAEKLKAGDKVTLQLEIR